MLSEVCRFIPQQRPSRPTFLVLSPWRPKWLRWQATPDKLRRIAKSSHPERKHKPLRPKAPPQILYLGAKSKASNVRLLEQLENVQRVAPVWFVVIHNKVTSCHIWWSKHKSSSLWDLFLDFSQMKLTKELQISWHTHSWMHKGDATPSYNRTYACSVLCVKRHLAVHKKPQNLCLWVHGPVQAR